MAHLQFQFKTVIGCFVGKGTKLPYPGMLFFFRESKELSMRYKKLKTLNHITDFLKTTVKTHEDNYCRALSNKVMFLLPHKRVGILFNKHFTQMLIFLNSRNEKPTKVKTGGKTGTLMNGRIRRYCISRRGRPSVLWNSF